MTTTAPGAAVVAATALSGCGSATLTAAETGEAVPVVHARTAAGVVVLLASREGVEALGLDPDGWGGTADDAVAELSVVVEAPLPDLTVPRAHVVVQGWVSLLPHERLVEAVGAVCALGDLAELRGQWPDGRLLLLDPAAARLHWAEGCAELPVEDLVAATADPVTLREAEVLARVEAELGDRLVDLVRAMGHAHPAPGARPSAEDASRDLGSVVEVRCVGADRTGMVLRCRSERPWVAVADGCGGRRDGAACAPGCEASTTATLRLLFPSPVADAAAAVDALALLVVGATSGAAACCPYAPGRRP